MVNAFTTNTWTNANSGNTPATAYDWADPDNWSLDAAPAANGALYVTGVDAQNPKGLEMPVTVTDAQHPNKLTRWAVYVDGELDDRLSAFVRKKSNSVEDTIVLDGKQGLLIRIR